MILIVNGLKQADYVRNIWRVSPKLDESFDDVLKPEYWSHVYANLQKGDIVEVMPEDSSYFARLVVRHVLSRAAVMGVLEKKEFDNVKQINTEIQVKNHFYIKLRGPKGWCVMRSSDDACLVEGIGSRDEAEEALYSYIKKLAA